MELQQKRLSALKDQRILLVLVIVAITAVVAFINPKFIEVRNITSILQQISVLGILTLAMTILLISGGIDLSMGNIMVLGGVVMATIITNAAAAGTLTMTVACMSVVACIAVCMGCGFVNGVIVAKTKCMPLVITLGTSQIFYGVSLTITKGSFMSLSDVFSPLSIKLFDVFPRMLILLAVMVAFAFFVLNFTKFGRRLVAIGGNEQNAYLSGINVDRYKIAVYTLSGLFCAVASVVFCARLNSITATAGSGYETNALTAAVVGGATFEGGRGTISGAFLGCLLMGVISNAMNILAIDAYTQTIVSGVIIVVAVVLSNVSKMKK